MEPTIFIIKRFKRSHGRNRGRLPKLTAYEKNYKELRFLFIVSDVKIFTT